MFYNTTNQKGEPLIKSVAKTDKQKQIVYKIFIEYHKLTASSCWNFFRPFNRNVPLTSIRRAITDLTSEGKLIKTEQKTKGMYGEPEYYYKLNLD